MSLVWSIQNDNELDSFDHEEPCDVFWGTDNRKEAIKAFISEGSDKIYVPEMGCVIKSFRLQLPEMKALNKQDKQN